jgi:ribose 5-phosphate isomerase B
MSEPTLFPNAAKRAATNEMLAKNQQALDSSIAANKVRGIRAAQVGDYYSARMTKAHNDANIICFGGSIVGHAVASACVKVWLETEVMGGNHPRRIEMIHQLEEKYAK